MVDLRIGSIVGHFFYPTGKPEDSRSGVAKGLRQPTTTAPLAP
jgi:predicted alpha/beta-hydrolase family hydrolase